VTIAIINNVIKREVDAVVILLLMLTVVVMRVAMMMMTIPLRRSRQVVNSPRVEL